jgi:hypothetical protein
MKYIAKLVSGIALLATIVPSALFFAGIVEHSAVKITALVGSIMWFVSTPMWMGRELRADAAEVEI